MSKSILVIGAGGFVGQHLVRALATQGVPVTAVTRGQVDFDFPTVETVIGELSEPEQFNPLIARTSGVIHLASRSTPGSTAGTPLIELDRNLRPMLSLLQSMQGFPEKPLLYLSSGGSLYAPRVDRPSGETSAISPRSYHGAGKIAAEYFISAWCNQYGRSASILRPSNIYGPGQRERAGFGVIPTAFHKIESNETLTIWGDGSAVRDYIYIDDFIALCLAVFGKSLPAEARVINAASGLGVSLNELLTLMETVSGKPLARRYEPGRAVDAQRIVMDISLANEEYSWKPRTSLHEGLKRTWDWFNTIQH